jgi:hypothetical protein
VEKVLANGRRVDGTEREKEGMDNSHYLCLWRELTEISPSNYYSFM